MKLSVLNRHILKGIPSASGIDIIDNTIYIIGDNTPWLFKLDKQYRVVEKFRIRSAEGLKDGKIPKPLKPDFEAMTYVGSGNKQELFIFGSGSKSPQRDVLVRVSVNNPANYKTYSLETFYKTIREAIKLNAGELNIEGAVADPENLYLLNRGKNIIFKLSLTAFLEHINNGGICPVPEVFHFKLAEIKGIEAGFSGATITPDKKKILFTASVENTPNWYDDGEVLGSFVGIINLQTLTDNITPVCIPITDRGLTLKIKVESIALRHIDPTGVLHLLLITDSDGDTSELFEVSMSLKSGDIIK
ncbi:MAG: hypothetical protein HYU69_16870 [Bacteroidetes bacterium]|nr:hypothetical protein [Bacteroidota bacterium]